MTKVVTVGGGTGSYMVLSGLKNIPLLDITALVSMADDGGSTGVLRDELGVLPPGDVRQCLTALSEHSDIVRTLMGYRFSEGALSGHSFGNIFLAALEKVTGDFATGVEIASEILKVHGKVLPVTKDKAELSLLLATGELVKGENSINHTDFKGGIVKTISYTEKVSLNPHAEEALLAADAVILGPGNYFCSLVPPLIVEGFKEVIKKTNARLILPVNLTNKHGHTLFWGVAEYVNHIETILERKVDTIIVNNELPSKEQIDFYKLEEGDGVMVSDNFEDTRVVRVPLLSRAIILHGKGDVLATTRSFIRHDKDMLAKAIQGVLSGDILSI